jgi:hypothetical protein
MPHVTIDMAGIRFRARSGEVLVIASHSSTLPSIGRRVFEGIIKTVAIPCWSIDKSVDISFDVDWFKQQVPGVGLRFVLDQGSCRAAVMNECENSGLFPRFW